MKKVLKITVIIASAIAVIALAFTVAALVRGFVLPPINYSKAVELYEQGNYTEAYRYFVKAPYYEDAQDYLAHYTVVCDRYIEVSPSGYRTVTEYTYDEYGNMTYFVRKNDNGDIMQELYYDYTYDENGNIIDESYDDYTGDNTTEYVYDEMGNLLKMTIFRDGVPSIVREHTYDSEGNMLTEKYTGGVYNGQISTYSYNSKGELIEEITENWMDTYVTTYENGRLKTQVQTDNQTGMVEWEFERFYRLDGTLKMSVSKSYTADSTNVSIDLFDSRENRTFMYIRQFSGDKDFYLHKFTYDEYGNIIRDDCHLLRISTDGEVETVSYTDYYEEYRVVHRG